MSKNGRYHLVLLSLGVILTAPFASRAATLDNISTRAFVGTGSNVAVGGFIVTGTGTKQVLLRGFGPTLTSFGVAGAIANPTLNLEWDDDNNPNTSAILILSNNDWGTAVGSCPAPVASCGTPTDIFNTGMSADTYAPSNPNRGLDAAMLLSLPPGTYTARLSGVAGGTGVGLIGVDDVDTNQSATLINISTRAFVGTGSTVAVGGFIITGTGNKQVLLRSFGPTLTSFGVAGALGNPTLDLEWDDDNNPNTPAVLVLSNNDWETRLGWCAAPVVSCGTPQDIVDTGLSADTYAPSSPDRALDAALLLTLPSGTYTARLSGQGGGTGVGLIGVDEVPISAPGSNQPPTAQSQSVAVAIDTPRVITLAGTDADADVLAFVIVSPPAYGTLSAVSGPSATYTPNAGYTGPDSFTFTVSDGGATSMPATVSLNVAGSAPVADSQSVVHISTRQAITPVTVVFFYAITLTGSDAEDGTASPPLQFKITDFPDVWDSTTPMNMVAGNQYRRWNGSGWEIFTATTSTIVDPVTGDITVSPPGAPVTIIYTPPKCTEDPRLSTSMDFTVADSVGLESLPGTAGINIDFNYCNSPGGE